jgi:hypothetical protein
LAHRPRGGGPRREDNDGDRGDRERDRHHEHEREREPHDDARAHHRIERHRFAGGLRATPERYALAREQWNRLPGAIVRPSMDPGVGAPTPEPQLPEQTLPSESESEQ